MNLYISSLGMASTKNGGLTNSAIKRINDFSQKFGVDNEYVVHYCYRLEETKYFTKYFSKKYNIHTNVKFINCHNDKYYDSVKDIYIMNNKELNYFEYVTYCLEDFLKKKKYKKIYLFLDTPFYPDYRNKICLENLVEIFIVHSSHLNFKEKVNIKKNYYASRAYFNNIENSSVYTVVPTKLQLEYIIKRSGNKKNYKHIPHYIEYTDYVKKEENYIIYLGRLSKDKKVDELINAFNELNLELKLYIYGDGPEKESLIKLSENNKNIHFKGITKKPLEVLKNAKIMIAPTNFEGFGLTILEALSVGVPVIASDVLFGPRELIKNNYNGYLYKDKEDLKEKIIFLLKDDKREEFSKNCIEVFENYKKDKILKKWELFLKEAYTMKELSEKIKKDINNEYLKISYNKVFLINKQEGFKYIIRKYDNNFNFYEFEIDNNINVNELRNGLLSLVKYNDYEFYEKELKIKKVPRIISLLFNVKFVIVKEDIVDSENKKVHFKYKVIK